MKRVQLVVTGKCEEVALHTSLQQLFPQADFSRPVRVESFTSEPLTEPPQSGITATIRKFAEKLVRTADASDDVLVMGVDDQEFEPKPERQVAAVIREVRAVIDGEPSMNKRDRLAKLVQARCSFHLLVPMVEAYFFGDREALSRAGAVRPSTFDSSSHDVEAFEVQDELFLKPPHDRDSQWARGGRDERARHPKRYLKYLSGDGSVRSWSYRETKHGKAALASLEWRLVSLNPVFAQSVRAFISDVADWLEVENPIPGTERPVTARSTSRLQRVLRNAG